MIYSKEPWSGAKYEFETGIIRDNNIIIDKHLLIVTNPTKVLARIGLKDKEVERSLSQIRYLAFLQSTAVRYKEDLTRSQKQPDKGASMLSFYK